MPSDKIWLSGDCIKEDGIYIYNSGPENGTLIFNTYSGESPSFSDFNYYEPSMFSFLDEWYIAYDNVEFTWNNMQLKDRLSFVCEYGGLEDPYIKPVRTIGDANALITNIRNLSTVTDVSKLKVTFTSSDSRQSFSATNIRKTSSTSITVNIPPGTGVFNLTITTNGQQPQYTWSTIFRYEAPHIALVYLDSVAQGTLVSITGKNFGSNSNMVSNIALGNNLATCSGVQVIEDGFLTCTLSSTIDTFIYPINITVDSIFYTATKPAINNNNRYLSTFWGNSNVTGSSIYSHALVAEGLSGYLSYVEQSTQSMYKLLARYYAQLEWPRFWTSLAYDTTQGFYITTDGPNANKQVTNYYPAPPTQAPAYIYDFVAMTYNVSLASNPWGTVSEFFIDSPQFELDTYSVPTKGATIWMLVSKGGTYFSQYSFQFQGRTTPFARLDYYPPRKDMTFDAGYGGPFPIIVTTNLKNKNLTTTKYFSYSPPSIIHMSNLGPNGGVITVTGDNFYTNASLISIKVGNDTCVGVKFVLPHQEFTCTIPTPSGSLLGGRNVDVSLNGTKARAPTIFQYSRQIIRDEWCLDLNRW
ncbi:hypothetical protein SAMD00019534_056290 [Acytostelium subglobosum LB1]|uniref:hypothetical protein n=1 Tax=Acytostelium subglobosum LB1 TaxID=1410327 RepID=UPI000644C430|nr:hypothetical protein SAMD00019534_056290 [Acytostelium subglobosum LB1]GAM22454.1 hypothetical protein SAMD00019534_056290 [Acytostelium subglobosum LB1]|eukprot:XP_012754574.1 hypothetical protein SAMD00019534_056290 [Acytostelium subglobosum LB1]